MAASLNRVTLIGTTGKYGFSLKTNSNGTTSASGSITISEQGKDGKAFESFYPVEVFGQHAARASDLQPGTLILIEGKLGKRKGKDGQYETIISCYDVKSLSAA